MATSVLAPPSPATHTDALAAFLQTEIGAAMPAAADLISVWVERDWKAKRTTLHASPYCILKPDLARKTAIESDELAGLEGNWCENCTGWNDTHLTHHVQAAVLDAWLTHDGQLAEIAETLRTPMNLSWQVRDWRATAGALMRYRAPQLLERLHREHGITPRPCDELVAVAVPARANTTDSLPYDIVDDVLGLGANLATISVAFDAATRIGWDPATAHRVDVTKNRRVVLTTLPRTTAENYTKLLSAQPDRPRNWYLQIVADRPIGPAEAQIISGLTADGLSLTDAVAVAVAIRSHT